MSVSLVAPRGVLVFDYFLVVFQGRTPAEGYCTVSQYFRVSSVRDIFLKYILRLVYDLRGAARGCKK